MIRVMGLDVGDVKIGVALSDPMHMIASPFEVIDRTKTKAVNRIKEIVTQKNVGKIVVGMPISLGGEKKIQAEKVLNFIEKLKVEMSEVEFIEVDERLSTVSANKMLNESTKKDAREKRKVVDKVAATIILQIFLDSKGRMVTNIKEETELEK